MLIGIVVISAVVVLVLVSRYREIPKNRRFSLRRSVRRQRFNEQCSSGPDETAKRFAEQWDKHPTLSKREAKAIKRSLRKKNSG